MSDLLPNKPLPKIRPPRHDLRKIPLLDGEENAVEQPMQKSKVKKLKVPKLKPNGGQ